MRFKVNVLAHIFGSYFRKAVGVVNAPGLCELRLAVTVGSGNRVLLASQVYQCLLRLPASAVRFQFCRSYRS
jgi:hypothetical protein